MKGGVDDNRDVPRRRICFEARGCFISGDSRQAEIHEDQIRMRCACLVYGFEACNRFGNVIAQLS